MTQERWQTFSRHDQMLNIASAIMRASNWQNRDQEKFLLAAKEALMLLKLTLDDPKWKRYLDALEYLASQLKKFLSEEKTENIGILYRAL